jgi:cell division transport system ATP-binding protein
MAQRLLYLFLELNKLGTTVVVATHNEGLIQKFTFPRLHLNKGQIHLSVPKNHKTEIKGEKNV